MSSLTVRFVRSDGRAFDIDGETLGLTAAAGLDKPNVEVFTQKAAVGDGDLVTGQRVGSRSLDFTAKVLRPALNDALRRVITSFFTGAQSYDIYIQREGARRYAADCRLDTLEIPTENVNRGMTVKLGFVMPEGYFRSADSFGRNLAGIEPRCGYPFAALAGVGRIYGSYSFAQVVYLQNDGDAVTYCRAVFTARGTVVNPKLIAGDGFVRVLCTLAEGDVLAVDGHTRSVSLNGRKISPQLDRQSRFDGIVFALGTNAVGFTADLGSNMLDVYVYYNKRYMGA